MDKLVCTRFSLCYKCGNKGHMLPCPQGTQLAKWRLFEGANPGLASPQSERVGAVQPLGTPQSPRYNHKRKSFGTPAVLAKDMGAACRLCGERILVDEEIVKLESMGLNEYARFYPQTGSVHGACFSSVRRGRIRAGLEPGDARHLERLEPVPQFAGPAYQDPSPEQTEIYKWVCNDGGNAIIDAKAGAAKSTTLLATLSLICWTPNFDKRALPRSQLPLILTFNKHNQKQLAECAPRHASEVLTFHAIGNRVWSARPMDHELFVNAREFDVKVDKVKRLVNSVIEEAVERKGASRADEKLASFVRELVKLAKCDALGVAADATSQNWQDLYAKFKGTLEKSLQQSGGDDQATALAKGIDYAGRCLHLSIEACFKKIHPFRKPTIDFSDQVYMPVWVDVRHPGLLKFEPRRWVFVDEAQDMNMASMLLLHHFVHPDSGRLVAVGDPAQALYGFAGATGDGMSKLTARFSAKVFPLSICWRCPKRHLEVAAALFKDQPSGAPVKPREGAAAGLLEWDCILDAIPDRGAAVLSRYNVHLIKLFCVLMRRGHPTQLIGRAALAEKLVKTLKDVWASPAVNSLTKPRALRDKLRELAEKDVREAESSSYESRIAAAKLKQDYLECLCFLLKDLHYRTYATPGDMLHDLQGRVADTFGATAKPSGGSQLLTLCTIHKAKGLEWECVYLLQPKQLFGLPEARAVLANPRLSARSVNDLAEAEERNCTNVALTRSKQMLYVLRSIDDDMEKLLPYGER